MEEGDDEHEPYKAVWGKSLDLLHCAAMTRLQSCDESEDHMPRASQRDSSLWKYL